jgi:hypothetical protein
LEARKIAIVPLFALSLIASCASNWIAPPSWTIRSDGHIRASQRDEDFTAEQFIAKVKQEENRDFGYVLTPAGEAEIARELRFRLAEITRLKNELQDCRTSR